MRRAFAVCLAALCLVGGPLRADAITDRLLAAIDAPRLLGILATEAETSARDIDASFLEGAGGAVLFDTVGRLNDPSRLLPILKDGLTEALDATTREAVTLFFESPLGQEIMALELGAREAFLDPLLEEAVRLQVAADGVRPQAAEIIRDADLIERNVADSANVLRQFYMGRRAGGADDLGPAEIELFVGEMVEGMRRDTKDWLESYLTMAYSPLDDDDMDTYAAFWRTEAGRAYDLALFSVFLKIYEENSFALGQLVGRLESSDEI